MRKEDRVSVGAVTSCHGVKGELRVRVLTDFPERFAPGEKLYVGRAEDEILQPVVVASSRWHKKALLVSIEGIKDRNSAEKLCGSFFWIDQKDVRKLPEGSFYIYELEGLTAKDMQGNELGRLTDVINTPAYDSYIIKGKEEIVVPAFKKFIKFIDMQTRTIVIDTESLKIED